MRGYVVSIELAAEGLDDLKFDVTVENAEVIEIALVGRFARVDIPLKDARDVLGQSLFDSLTTSALNKAHDDAFYDGKLAA